MARAADERAGGGARDEQHAGEHERDADDDRARAAENPGEPSAERLADGAAVVLAEGDQQADGADHEPRPEGAQVDELAADEHQPADRDQRERDERRRGSERRLEPVGETRADRPAVPAEPDERREHEPERGQPEAPELGMVVPAGLLLLLADA